MIKLIASDMDGTLLDDAKRLPPDFFALVEELHARGVHFVAGSGRSYPAQKITFAPVLDQMDFICDNGAFVMEAGEVTSVTALPRAEVAGITAAVLALGEDVCPVLCGVKGSYLPKGSFARFGDALKTYYAYAEELDAPGFVADDIVKIAVYTERPAAEASFPPLHARYGAQLGVVRSGANWVDVMVQGVNKGAGLARIQKRLGVTPQETMAFGDFYNDVEMLACAAYSFVMENAEPGMRRYGRFCAPSNEERGVTKLIRAYVLEGQALPALE